jgi:hypothetical protein
VAWLNGTLQYPFGKNLAYEINVTLPRGSEIIQILSDGNFTVEDNMIVWNTPIDGLAIEFAPPNVAITGVVPAKTVVSQDCRTSVNVTVANHSNSTQAVNITVYANAIIISAQTASIESKMSTTIVLDWNTTGFALGTYNIWAYVEPVLGETHIDDNTFVDGWVIVSIPGDINGDGKVDWVDVGMVYRALGSWNSDCDLNCDGKVNYKDVSLEFGYYLGWVTRRYTYAPPIQTTVTAFGQAINHIRQKYP